jgi:predicted GTPase
MPYGDLARQRVQRFANHADLVTHDCTIEEIEEYEQYVERGLTIFAGVDYGAILAEAEKDGDLVLWDGGNNDTPFIRPDLHIVVVDPLRAGHELLFHPGETNLCMADVVVINKVDRAAPEDLEIVLKNIEAVNPAARIIQADSEVMLENPEQIQGRRVLVIEDGPTLTHGGMAYGAGTVAAQRFGAGAVIDPAPYAVGSIAEAYKKFPHMGAILPALGYYPEQLSELEETIRRADCDAVIVGTPVDLRRYVKIDQPALRVTYELAERAGELTLSELVDEFVLKHLS